MKTIIILFTLGVSIIAVATVMEGMNVNENYILNTGIVGATFIGLGIIKSVTL